MGGDDMSLGLRSLREGATQVYERAEEEKRRELARRLAEAQIKGMNLDVKKLENELALYDLQHEGVTTQFPIGGRGGRGGQGARQPGPATPSTQRQPPTGMRLGTLGGPPSMGARPGAAQAPNMWLGGGAGAPAPTAQPTAQPSGPTTLRPVTALDQAQIQQGVQNGVPAVVTAYNLGLISADQLPEATKIAMRVAPDWGQSNLTAEAQRRFELEQERNEIAAAQAATDRWSAEANVELGRDEISLRTRDLKFRQQVDWRNYRRLSPARVAEMQLAHENNVSLAAVEHGYRVEEIGEGGRQARLTDQAEQEGPITPGSPEAARMWGIYMEARNLLDEPFSDMMMPPTKAAEREAMQREFFGESYAAVKAMEAQAREALVEAGLFDQNVQLPEPHSWTANVMAIGPVHAAVTLHAEGYTLGFIEDQLNDYANPMNGERVPAGLIEAILHFLELQDIEPTSRQQRRFPMPPPGRGTPSSGVSDF